MGTAWSRAWEGAGSLTRLREVDAIMSCGTQLTTMLDMSVVLHSHMIPRATLSTYTGHVHHARPILSRGDR